MSQTKSSHQVSCQWSLLLSEVSRWNLETLAIEVLVVSQKSLLPTFLSMGAVSQPELCKYNLFLIFLLRV